MTAVTFPAPGSPSPAADPSCDLLHSGHPAAYRGWVTGTRSHLLLALAVLVGSALPFVPTGEMVSGAAAFAAHSRVGVAQIFVITWACSIAGDTIMLVGARLGARRLADRLARGSLAGRIEQARAALTRNAFNAIVTGRLIPGGRTPVIVALGLSQFSVRRFVLIDMVACALWAGVYSVIGSVGGRVASHPIWAMVVAVAFAVSLGVAVQQLQRLVVWRRSRGRAADEDRAQKNAAESATPAPE